MRHAVFVRPALVLRADDILDLEEAQLVEPVHLSVAFEVTDLHGVTLVPGVTHCLVLACIQLLVFFLFLVELVVEKDQGGFAQEDGALARDWVDRLGHWVEVVLWVYPLFAVVLVLRMDSVGDVDSIN